MAFQLGVVAVFRVYENELFLLLQTHAVIVVVSQAGYSSPYPRIPFHVLFVDSG